MKQACHLGTLVHMHRCALVIGLALLLGACGRAAPIDPTPLSVSAFEVLVASPPDALGNTVTSRFDSATGQTRTTSTPGNASTSRFTAAGGISYLLPDSIHSDDPTTGPRTVASDRVRVIAAYAWSAGGSLAYVAHSAGAAGSQLVIEPSAGHAATVQLPTAARGDRPQLRFSPDGSRLLLVDTALAGAGPRPTLQVRGLDGSLVFGPTGTAATPSEATWAGSGKLYFWDGRGVNVADLSTGATRTILPGVRWYDPDPSPDGRTIVFERRDSRGRPRLELLDATTDRVVQAFERDGGSLARFVSPTEIWFHEVGVCASCSGVARVRSGLVDLDIERRTEEPTGLNGFVTDVRLMRGGA